MAEQSFKWIRHLAILAMISAIALSTLSSLHLVQGQTQIVSLTPLFGNVGTDVRVLGEIVTPDGNFSVFFDEAEVTQGIAEGNVVNVSFSVLNTFSGDHTVTLVGTETNETATATFRVTPLYSLEVGAPDIPEQLQESDEISISINVTGGERDATLAANITVQASTNASYASIFNFTTSSLGAGEATVTYPRGFSAGANTDFVGDYNVYLNGTIRNATFTVGLTNSTEYHRLQTLNVKASGYKTNENVTLTISNLTETVHEANLTAVDGILQYAEWSVPANASMGLYTVNITSISANATTKVPPDFQDFLVPGFDVNVTTMNLAGEPVPNLQLRVLEADKHLENITSNSEGRLRLELEVGNYTLEGYYRSTYVGERWIYVTNASSLELTYNLTSIRVHVQDREGHSIPEVRLDLSQNGVLLLQGDTDRDGIGILYSLLPDMAYTLNSSRYNMNFSETTVQQLPTIDWFNLTVICPSVSLHVNATGAEGLLIDSATVRAFELMGGINYEANIVGGSAELNCTFGRYSVEVYVDGVRLNGTTVDLFSNRNLSMVCRYYGLRISVQVIDYFGQVIPGATVSLEQRSLPPLSSETGADGLAVLDNIIGGDLKISVYLKGETLPCVETVLFAESSRTIPVKIEKYVLFAGAIVETSHLTTLLVIVAAIVLVLFIEVFRKRRLSRKDLN